MKITIVFSGGRAIEAKRPPESSKVVETDETCPECKEPLRVYGGDTTQDHDTYSAPAYCWACRSEIGTIKVRVQTIFGIEEDNAVLNGRCRVY